MASAQEKTPHGAKPATKAAVGTSPAAVVPGKAAPKADANPENPVEEKKAQPEAKSDAKSEKPAEEKKTQPEPITDTKAEAETSPAAADPAKLRAEAGGKSGRLVEVAMTLLKSAQERRARKLRLSLRQCVAIAIDNSLDLKIERVSPLQAAEDVIVARAAFDPAIVSGSSDTDALLRYSSGRVEAATIGAGPTSTTSGGGNIQLRIPTHTGGSVSVGYDVTQVDPDDGSSELTLDPYWQSNVFVALSHPLLRGSGLDYNLAGIRVAANNKTISNEEFRNQAIGIVFNVEQAYWNLVRAIEDLEVSVKSLQVALKNRQSSWLQFLAGTKPELEVITADSGVAVRLSAVIRSEASVRDREDDLKEIVNLPEDWHLADLQILPADRPRRNVEQDPLGIGLAEAIQIALRRRPEIRQAELAIRNSSIRTRTRRNELLPKLDASASLGYHGVDRTYGRAADSMGTLRHHEAGVALTFEYPIGNRAARALWRRSKLAKRRAKLGLQRARQAIIVRVRAAIRRINTDRKRVMASRKAKELQGKRLEAEQRKKEVGRATSLDVLNVEEDYVASQRDHVNALIDYQITLAAFEKALGTLLDVRSIRLSTSPDPGERNGR